MRAKAITNAIVKAGIICNATPPDLNNPHEAAGFDMLTKLMAKHFSDLTEHEIVEAFEINIMGEEWEKIKPYQGITFELCADVLKNYRKTKAKAMANLNQLLQNQEQQKRIEATKATDQEQYEFILDYYKQHQTWPMASYASAFRHLWITNRSLIDENIKWFEEMEQIIIRRTKNQMATAISTIERDAIEKSLTNDFIQAEVKRAWVIREISRQLNIL